MEERAVELKSEDGKDQAAMTNRDWMRMTNRDWTGLAAGGVLTILAAYAVSFLTIYYSTLPEADVTLPRSQVAQIDKGPLAGSVAVGYIGSISRPGVIFIEKELEKIKERPLWLSMQSGGGDIEAEGMLLKYTTAAGIGIAIPDDGQCASACALLYAAAAPKLRYASPDAYFGFHYRVTAGTIFNFKTWIINYESFDPMTVPSILEPFTSDIPNRKIDLATFFNSCSGGDPTHSRRAIYLQYKQIVSIVQGSSELKCDKIKGQDTTWLNEQVSPIKEPSKGTDR